MNYKHSEITFSNIMWIRKTMRQYSQQITLTDKSKPPDYLTLNNNNNNNNEIF